MQKKKKAGIMQQLGVPFSLNPFWGSHKKDCSNPLPLFLEPPFLISNIPFVEYNNMLGKV